MGSKIALKNAQDQEFSINHLDNAGAIAINSNDISTKSEIETTIAPYNKGFKNYIINGNFDVAQRGTVFANNTATGKQYTLDRWSTYFYNLDNTRFVNTTTGEVSNNAIKFGRFDNKIDTFPSCLAQELEIKDSVPLRGKTVTLSFWAKKGSGLSNDLNITFATGTTGDESWAVGYTGAVSDTKVVPLTTTLSKYTYTYTLNSNIKQIGVTFTIPSHSVSATINDWVWIEQIQLEEGSVATPFEQRPYGLELSLCQRYYQHIFKLGIIYSNTYYYETVINLPVTMRVAPTGTGNFSVTAGNAGTLSTAGSSPYAVSIYNSAANWTPNASANIYIQLSAEL